jgi:putative ABC transport system permease protein
MLSNIFKIALRNIFKNKLFSAINIFGLSVGISAFLLLFLYIYNEVTYDRFHANHARIYRLMENHMAYSKGLVVPYILENFPEVENGSRYLDWSEKVFRVEDKDYPQQIHYVDTGFFSLFSFRFVEGNPMTALSNKYSVILTKRLAHSYFGDEPALNKTIVAVNENQHLTVTGVVEDIPTNSSIRFSMLTNYETGLVLDPWLEDIHDWYNTFSESYIMVKEGTDIKALEEKFVPFVETHFLSGDTKPKLNLLALSNLHDHQTSNKSFTYILICIALGILLIASANFVNLSTVLSYSRFKEVGMKKTLGANKSAIRSQFLGESITISLFAVCFGIALTIFILPVYNQMFETKLVFNVFENPYLLMAILSIWIVSGTLSGFIPAIHLSKLTLLESLKGKVKPGRRNDFFKHSLVSLQFVVAIFLMIGTIVIIKQINFMKSHALNFDAENVIIIRTNISMIKDQEAAIQKLKVVVNELENDPRVISTTVSSQVPGTYIENYNNFYTNGWAQEEKLIMRQTDIGADYFKTYGVKFIEGDPIREKTITEPNLVVINETAYKMLKAESAVDNYLYGSSRSGEPFKIIGVVEDFHYQGLHREIQPLIHFYRSELNAYGNFISVRVLPGQTTALLDVLNDKWKSVPPALDLDYFFANEEINKQYRFVTQTSSLAAYFSALAIIISCLGLFAMIIYITTRKIKEIGIRKVVGANEKEILLQLLNRYAVLIFTAFVLAVPLSHYFMGKWLESFAYKTDLSLWVYALAGLLAMCIALATVSWQSWRAATRNPVEALRYE